MQCGSCHCRYGRNGRVREQLLNNHPECNRRKCQRLNHWKPLNISTRSDTPGKKGHHPAGSQRDQHQNNPDRKPEPVQGIRDPEHPCIDQSVSCSQQKQQQWYREILQLFGFYDRPCHHRRQSRKECHINQNSKPLRQTWNSQNNAATQPQQDQSQKRITPGSLHTGPVPHSS